MKKVLYIVITGIVVLLLVVGFVLKNNLNRYISQKMKEQTPNEISVSVKEVIQRKYNYVENGKDYDFTFLEFSSSGCAICKQMEPVLEEIKNSDRVKVNVVFLHIMKPENLSLMKHYGISAVPMQVLLDKKGNEFFRHYGFIPADELLLKFHSS